MENLLVFYSISIQIRFGVSKDKADLVYIQTFVMSIQNTYYFYTHSTNIRGIHTTCPMPAGIWGRAAKLVFISIMVDTTEYSTFCLKALKAYLLHFTAHKISNLENFYIEVLRTSQRGNQVEKVGEMHCG